MVLHAVLLVSLQSSPKSWCFMLCSCYLCKALANHGASCHALGIFAKLSMSTGAPTWFGTVCSCGVKAIDY